MIVSAIPFTGNKRKLWDKISTLLPKGEVFLDLFAGGGTMAINATELYPTVYAGEVIPQFVRLHRELQEKDFLKTVTRVNNHYLSTKDGYLKLREDYNISRSSSMLLNLILRSNTNYARFNRKGEFNMPYGERNHHNIARMTQHQRASEKVQWFKADFEVLAKKVLELEAHTGRKIVVYSDSPYSGTLATYNENGGWTKEDDVRLQETLLAMHDLGCSIVISNVFQNKGNVNQVWVDWCELHKHKFKVHHLNHSYNNSSFRKSAGITDEVLIVSRNKEILYAAN